MECLECQLSGSIREIVSVTEPRRPVVSLTPLDCVFGEIKESYGLRPQETRFGVTCVFIGKILEVVKKDLEA